MVMSKTRLVRESRRADAVARQTIYDKLSLEQKLAKLPPEPHAARERAKLQRQIDARNNKPVVVEKATATEENAEKPKKASQKRAKD